MRFLRVAQVGEGCDDAVACLHWSLSHVTALFGHFSWMGIPGLIPMPSPMLHSDNVVTITLMTDPNVLLISRVLSIVPMNLKSEDWGSNIVVRDLCAFHVLFKSLYKTLRNLCEIIMMIMFMDNRVKATSINMDRCRSCEASLVI